MTVKMAPQLNSEISLRLKTLLSSSKEKTLSNNSKTCRHSAVKVEKPMFDSKKITSV